uniref:Uncharacterized protein n=1 Tax=Erysiphe necator associated chrysovirus 1 TaxID=2742542 RepID=A0A8E3YWH3_9VIRU|nr:hypothetical protein [Erysiphe necator associated chrysovirus 1]
MSNSQPEYVSLVASLAEDFDTSPPEYESLVHFDGEDDEDRDADDETHFVDVEEPSYLTQSPSVQVGYVEHRPPPAYEAEGTRLRRDAFISAKLNVNGAHMGLPYGPDVAAIAWADADLASGNLPPMNVALVGGKLIGALHGGLDEEVRIRSAYKDDTPFVLLASPGYEVSTRNGPVTDSEFFELRVGNDVLIAVYYQAERGEFTVNDVVLADKTRRRLVDGQVRRQTSAALSCLQYAMLQGLMLHDITMLANSGLKEMKRVVSRSETGVSLRMPLEARSYAVGALFCEPKPEFHEAKGDVKVDVIYETNGNVAHGTVNAWDVPSTLIVALGSNSGKSLTGSSMVVRSESTQKVFIHTTSGTSGLALRDLKNGRKCAPMVRDGLLSPLCCAALKGLGDGSLTVQVDDDIIHQRTILTDLSAGERRVVVARDVESVLRGIYDVSMLNGFGTHIIGNTVHIDGATVTVMYGPASGPRWLSLLSDQFELLQEELQASEEYMDHGCSGLARHMLRQYIDGARLVNCDRIVLPKCSHFSSFRKEITAGRRAGLGAVQHRRVDFVVDFEYYTAKDGQATRCVPYAIGVAKYVAGNYIASAAMMVTDEQLRAERRVRKFSPTTEMAVKALGKSDIKRGPILDLVLALREAIQDPSVRVYCKGRDNDSVMTKGDYCENMRWFTANGADDRLRELGPMTDRYEVLAARQGWSALHNPAREAVLFAHECGIGNELPDEADAGNDSWTALRHVHTAVYI